MEKQATIDFEELKDLIEISEMVREENYKLKGEKVREKARADRFMLEILDNHYSKFGLDSKEGKEGKEKRANINSGYFGLNDTDKLFRMGITYEQMIDYILRKDEEEQGYFDIEEEIEEEDE